MSSSSIALYAMHSNGSLTLADTFMGSYGKCASLFSQMSSEYAEEGRNSYQVLLLDDNELVVSAKLLRNVSDGTVLLFA
ncbi:hypothetical protein [Vibrio breoganii]|uniref:hypothetical protein n=1 Tax=Vibrio breoganii TaxID=553239 RepID=UPI0021C28835|nr:hypothetical protein [Vibrio breoganii]MDN3714760.1 hypothetical protein [Vibrio breoganii]